MPQKIHILRADSITPIDRYLSRRRSRAGDYATQLEFACLLLYREREFRSMYSSSWRPDRLPTAANTSAFTPHGLTADAAASIAASVRNTWGESVVLVFREDLFGLKQEALDGLAGVLRPVRRHAFGYVLAARLARDLTQFREAIAFAEKALDLDGSAIAAVAMVQECAVIAPESMRGPDVQKFTARMTRRARTILTPRRRWRPNWSAGALEDLDEQIRRRAIRARTSVEGIGFTRFLSTDTDFCERERRVALRGFKANVVPRGLRGLVRTAQRVGVGDDACRALTIRKLSRAERARIVKSVDPLSARIDEWLKNLNGPPYATEASCFFWLLEAVEEMRA